MRGRFYATEQISDNIEKTPEGFLILHDVPLARTGVQIYAPEEVPPDIPGGPDGIVQIERNPEDVFRPETMASAAGKPFVNEHPVKGNNRLDVTTDNWREFACGTIFHPHRGEGTLDDLFFGDIVAYDPKTIDDILTKKKREISLGYDADYDVIGEGHARQTNIVINHAALVEQGRCGPRCQIRDEEGAMAGTTATKPGWRDFLRRAYRARDAGELETIEKEAAEMEPGNGADPGGGPDEHHIHVHLPGGEKEKEEDHGMRSNTRFTDPDPNGGGEPNGGEGGGNMQQQILAAIQDLVSRVEALEDAMGAGHGGGTAPTETDSRRDDRRRDDRRRDTRSRDEDEDKDETRDEEPNASEEGANESTEAILGQIEFEAPPGTADSMRKARDSANPFFQDIFQETRASCEIIAPGMRLPAFDRKASPTKTFDCICDMRRQALAKAYDDPQIHDELDAILAHQPLDTRSMPVRDLSVLFRAVASHKRMLNNSYQSRDTGGRSVDNGGHRGPPTPAEINARNKAFKEAGGWGPGAGMR
jgi:hypothetical protein